MAAKRALYVLDSFALLAYLEGEAGRSRVKELLDGAEAGVHSIHMSLVNLGEVLYITERERSLQSAQRAWAAIDQMPLQFAPVLRATVLAAAHIKAHYHISYADAFAAVVTLDSHAILVTGDPEFKILGKDNLLEIEWLS